MPRISIIFAFLLSAAVAALAADKPLPNEEGNYLRFIDGKQLELIVISDGSEPFRIRGAWKNESDAPLGAAKFAPVNVAGRFKVITKSCGDLAFQDLRFRFRCGTCLNGQSKGAARKKDCMKLFGSGREFWTEQ